jgi:DNA invertase Pin-like site-specific DNA recombinase
MTRERLAPKREPAQRVAIYARVSTQDQAAQMQLDCLREYASARGLRVVEEYVDQGVSGARSRRPALDRLMDAARKRALDVVLVYRFDRFARSVRHLLEALDEFHGLGVGFVSYTENLDTATPMGRCMFAIMGALAELERALILERSAEGQRRARARGVHVGRPRRSVDADMVGYWRKQGESLRTIATRIGTSTSIVRRVLKEAT